jgi:hypothetical protein
VDEMGWDGSDHDRFIQRRFVSLEPLSSRKTGLLWHTTWLTWFCYMSTPNSVWDLGQACYHLRPRFHWGTVPMIILRIVLRWDFLQGFVSNTTYVHWSDPVKTYMSWTENLMQKVFGQDHPQWLARHGWYQHVCLLSPSKTSIMIKRSF